MKLTSSAPSVPDRGELRALRSAKAQVDPQRAIGTIRERERRRQGWAVRSIGPWNLAGLGNPKWRNLYPVDLDLLVERADLLGLSRSEARRRLPLLRGEPLPTAP